DQPAELFTFGIDLERLPGPGTVAPLHLTELAVPVERPRQSVCPVPSPVLVVASCSRHVCRGAVYQSPLYSVARRCGRRRSALGDAPNRVQSESSTGTPARECRDRLP